KVDQSTVDKELEALRKSHAKKKSLEADTVAAKGMVAVISHNATIEGSPFAPLTAEKISVELGEGQTMKEIDDALIGLKAGEGKTIQFPLSDDFPDKSLAGKQVDLEVKLEELHELALPELDDEFAKDVGAESL